MNSSMQSSQYDAYDVLHQNITMIDIYGHRFTTQLNVIDYLLNFSVAEGIIYGTQVGACLILLLILLLLSKRDKRSSPIFIFNSLSLFFNTIYAILQCCYYTSSWISAYSFLSLDLSLVGQGAKNLTVAVAIFLIFTSICIEVSLVLQVHVVSITMRPLHKLTVMVTSVFVALIAIGFRMARLVTTLHCNLHQESFCNQWVWLDKAKDITLTISVCFFSAVFCAKLGWSLRERRKLGMRQFGSMQIIFIGGFQTMIIPAIFSVIQFAVNAHLPQIGSNILTITCISLPLTSLWASSSANSPNKAARGPDAHRKFLVDSSTADSTRKASIGGGAWQPSPAKVAGDGNGNGSGSGSGSGRLGVLNSISSEGGKEDGWGKYSPGVGVRDVDRDLEMQELKERE